jgi:hypothetical protein
MSARDQCVALTQSKHLVMPLDDALLDLPEPTGVVLLFGLRFERASLGGHEQPIEAP